MGVGRFSDAVSPKNVSDCSHKCSCGPGTMHYPGGDHKREGIHESQNRKFVTRFSVFGGFGDTPLRPPPPAPPGKIGVRKCSSTENQVSVMYYDLLNFEGDPTSLSIRSNSDKKN